MSLCTAFEGVNSSLPFATSSPREQPSPPAAGARSNSTSYQAGNLVSKLGVKADRLPENQRKKEVPFFSPAPWLLAPPFRLARGDFADFDGTVGTRASVRDEGTPRAIARRVQWHTSPLEFSMMKFCA